MNEPTQDDSHDQHEFYIDMLRRLHHAAASYYSVFPPTITNRTTEDAGDGLADALREIGEYLNQCSAAAIRHAPDAAQGAVQETRG